MNETSCALRRTYRQGRSRAYIEAVNTGEMTVVLCADEEGSEADHGAEYGSERL